MTAHRRASYKLSAQLNLLLEPIREKRRYYEEHPNELYEIVAAGTRRANQIGAETMAKVKSLMQLPNLS